MEEKDIFVNRKIYPNPADIFSVTTESVAKIKNKAIYIIDTNALLLPYTTSSKSIEEIKKVYGKLISKNKLFIPSQVAREFAKSRPEKIKEIFQQLNRKQNKIQKLFSGKYPLLSDSKEYQEAVEMEEKIDSSLKDYSKKLSEVIGQIKNWTWDDPVTKAYNSIFEEKIIVDVEETKEKIKSDLAFRYSHKIPPGYKDDGKPDDGIGDYLIWLNILELAKKLNKDVIFVSGDEKSDWFHRSENQSLYPRFELVSEFREKGAKKSFHIIKLSELLEIFGADETIVKELELEEKTTRYAAPLSTNLQWKYIKELVYNWFYDNYGGNYLLKINNVSFPDILIKRKDEKIGVRILRFNSNIEILSRVTQVYNKISFMNFTKFFVVIILPDESNLELISKESEYILSDLNFSKFKIELLFGYIDDNQKMIFNS